VTPRSTATPPLFRYGSVEFAPRLKVPRSRDAGGLITESHDVGIYVWDQYASSCSDVTVKSNRVDWTNKSGAEDPWWNGGNCAALTESGNGWSATLGETILAAVPEPCR